MEYNSVKDHPLLKQHVIYCGRHALLRDPDIARNRCLISISDTPAEWSEMLDFRKADWALQLLFSDVEEGEAGCMSEVDAHRILTFIELHQQQNFIVHCFVGTSRSAAIAKFIVEYLELDDSDTANLKYYNEYVYNTLKSLV